jgi:hypothetical protein
MIKQLAFDDNTSFLVVMEYNDRILEMIEERFGRVAFKGFTVEDDMMIVHVDEEVVDFIFDEPEAFDNIHGR